MVFERQNANGPRDVARHGEAAAGRHRVSEAAATGFGQLLGRCRVSGLLGRCRVSGLLGRCRVSGLLGRCRVLATSILAGAALVLAVGCSDGQSRMLNIAGLERISASDAGADTDGWPSSTAGAYLVGRFALEHGDLVTATDQFNQALEADPDNVELRRQLFAIELARGNFDTKEARSLLAIDDSAEEARLLLGLAAAKDGDFKEAGQRFGDIGPRGIAAIVAPTLRAWALYGQGNKEPAREMLRGGRADDGFDGLRAYDLAMMDALDGKVEAARAQLAALVPDGKPAPLRIVMALAAFDVRQGHKDDARAMLMRQDALYEENAALESAMAQVDAGQEPPVALTDAAAGMADTLMSLAAALQDQQLAGQALIFARLATYLAPDAGDTQALIGRSLLSQGNYDAAIAAFDAVPPGSIFAWDVQLLKVGTLDGQNRFDEATAILRKMATERPERTDALVTLGDMLRQKEKFAEAEQAYSEAIRRLPQRRQQNWRLYYARGISYERTDRWPQAEADFKKALQLEPDQPYVLNYLGYSWVDKGVHLDEAKKMLHQAVDLRPEDGFVVDSLGWAYFRLGDYQESVNYLERAVELQPGDPTINDHLGDAYWRSGRQREARFQWSRALTLEPTKDQVAGIEKKVNDGLPKDQTARPNRG